MNIQNFSSPYKGQSVSYWIAALALIAGLALSVLSWAELCVEHCSANQDYRLFGLPFAITGMLFFTVLTSFHLLSPFYPLLSTFVGWMVALALGSEVYFIAVQKYQIGHWCPICLSIAFSLLITALALIGNYMYTTLKQGTSGDTTMNKIKKTLTSLSLFVIGFLMAFAGVTKVDPLAAAVADMKSQLEMGTHGSPVEVYFVSDWFCPSCKKVEPRMEKIYAAVQSKVSFFFVDYPIHAKSMNFSPYNLAFLINDKAQYLKARHMLQTLAEQTDSPKEIDIIKQAKKEGLNFKELSFLDVKTGMQYFDDIVQKYELDATPILIVYNTKTNKYTKLEGTEGITEEKVLKAVDKISSAK